MESRNMVVQTRTSLPKMAKTHTWVTILPESLPLLYIWHTTCRHAGPLTSSSSCHRFFWGDWANSAEDEERVVLALEQRHRIRRIRFRMPVSYMRKLIVAIEKEYPALEYLVMVLVPADKNTVSILPETLQAPASASPRAEMLCPSTRMWATHDCRGHCLTPSFHRPPIRLLPAKYSGPTDFTYATARDTRNPLFHLYFLESQPLHCLTFTGLSSKVLATILKRSSIGSPPLASKSSSFSYPNNVY